MGILQNLTGWHFLVVLVIVLLIFGATRLPALAKSVGQSTKILREELKSDPKPDAAKTDAAPSDVTSAGTTTSTSDKP